MTAHVFLNTYTLIMIGLASLAGGITLGLIFQRMRQKKHFDKMADEYCNNIAMLAAQVNKENTIVKEKNRELKSCMRGALASLAGAEDF